jgi:FAD/FMN-containing dehydrogenase
MWNLERENIKEALKEIRDVVGERFATDEKAILINYSRDFTIASGTLPHIVALPSSTKEVSDILKIARRRKIPVIPFSTGFNHGGLTLPRRGGIVLDLKRMRKIEINPETMTATIGPGVRNADLYLACSEFYATEGIKLRPCLPLTMGSISTLANYIARGGPGITVRYGFSSDLICGITWVLPDGEVIYLGTHSEDKNFSLPTNICEGPDLMGAFVAADGAFGVCTEMTIRLVAEFPFEKLFLFDSMEREKSLECALSFVKRIARLDIAEFIYKSHTDQLANMSPMDNPLDLVELLPEHPVVVIISGNDEEEIKVREEILLKVAQEEGMYAVDLELLNSSIGEEKVIAPEYWKKIGPRVGGVMRFKGSFQWTAGNVRFDRVKEVIEEYERLVRRYWMKDPSESRKRALTGPAIQGPYPFARLAPLEFDFWFDQGNPDDIKRATIMLRKVTELFVHKGATMFRKMYGFGEIELPLTGTYFDVLKSFKRLLDPENIMHPDLHPIYDTFV